MDDSVETTQIRPALKSPKRRRVLPSPADQKAPQRTAQRQGARSRHGARPSGRPYTRNADASQRAARQSSAPRSRNARRPANAAPKRRSGVPIPAVALLTLLAIVVTAVASVLITQNLMMPRIEEAEKKAATAQSQVTTLTQQLAKSADAKTDKAADEEKEDAEGSENEESSNKKSADAKDKEQKEDKEQKDKEDKEKKGSEEAGVESPWVKSGPYTTGDTVLDSEVKAYCDSIVDTSLSQDSAAFEVYKSIAWSDYVERDAAQHPSGENWRTEFARMYYENGCSGNCYEFASFLSYCLQYLGYEDAVAEGVEIEFQSGNWGDHGIVFVTNTDGSSCICDTARGTDAWMISPSSYNMQIMNFESA